MRRTLNPVLNLAQAKTLTPTGRQPTQPQYQTLPACMTPADRELRERVKRSMRRKPEYSGIPSATSASSHKYF